MEAARANGERRVDRIVAWLKNGRQGELGAYGYLNAAGQYATCKLLGQFGNPALHPELAALVAFHDDATRVPSGLPLA